MKLTSLFKYGLMSVLTLCMITGCKKEIAPQEDVSPVYLQIVGDDVVLLGFNESRELAVRARYESNGEPAPNRKVSFRVSGTANNTTLEGTDVFTDDSGIATTTVKASDQKANFDVVVSSGATGQVSFNVDVNGQDIGSLRVYYSQPANTTVTLKSLETKIHPAPLFDCDSYDDWSELPDHSAVETSNSVSLPVVFNDLRAGDRYTISVQAIGPEGNVIARGCTKSGEIVGRKTVDATVTLALMPVTLTGTYQIATTLNLTEMIPGGNNWTDENGKVSAAAIVNAIIGFFQDPGNYVVNTGISFITNTTAKTIVSALKSAAPVVFETYFCPGNDGVPETDPETNLSDGDTEEAYWYDSAHNVTYSCLCVTDSSKCDNRSKKAPADLGHYLNILITYYAPSWVTSIFTVGNDIAELVQHLVVGGELSIDKAIADDNGKYTLEGSETWNSYMFTWKLGKNCEAANDACCGQTVFGAGAASNNKLNAASSTFTGSAEVATVAGQSAYYMTLDKHTVSLDYGNIMIYLLENLAFPAMSKLEAPVSFSDVLIKMIPLENISCWLSSIGSNKYDSCMETCTITATPNSSGTRDWKNDNCGGQIGDYVIQLFSGVGNFIDEKISSLSTSGTTDYKFVLETNNQYQTTNYISDTNQDLQADRIDLQLKGYVYLGSATSQATEMTGSMNGEFARIINTDMTALDRTSCHSDAQCVAAIGDGRTCQIREGLVSKCAERMVCALNVGGYAGGTTCVVNGDCASGYCIPSTKTCYSACSGTGDCSASTPVCNSNINYDFFDSNGDFAFNAAVSSCVPN